MTERYTIAEINAAATAVDQGATLLEDQELAALATELAASRARERTANCRRCEFEEGNPSIRPDPDSRLCDSCATELGGSDSTSAWHWRQSTAAAGLEAAQATERERNRRAYADRPVKLLVATDPELLQHPAFNHADPTRVDLIYLDQFQTLADHQLEEGVELLPGSELQDQVSCPCEEYPCRHTALTAWAQAQRDEVMQRSLDQMLPF